MRTVLFALVCASLFCAVDASAQTVPADAYHDDQARELVRLARARRVLVDRRIQAYQTTARERISVSLSAGIAEKLLFRRETVSRIDWTRDTVRIEVLAAQEVLPPVQAAPQVPAGLSGWTPVLAFDPVDSEMLMRFDSTVLRHPLSAGSEQHYQFRSGDSTVITLPDNRSVRLRELQFIPRRHDIHLITGSFWLDMETHAVVQAYFRPATRFGEESGIVAYSRDSTGRGNINLGGQLEIEYIAIDYGLWDLRWWLPRVVAMRALGQTVGVVRAPMTYERTYADYTVIGDTTIAAATDAVVPDMETRPCRPRPSFVVRASVGEPDSAQRARRAVDDSTRRAVADSTRRAAADSLRRAAADSAGAIRPARDSERVYCDRPFVVTQLEDSVLLNSALLSRDIYDPAPLIDPAELRSMARRVAATAIGPIGISSSFRWGLGAQGLTRYNRVEGLSTGVRAAWGVGRYRADVEARVGSADREPRGHIALSRTGVALHTTLAAYRRLEALDIPSRPFGTSTLVRSLILGDDDNDYFQATGTELRIQPLATRTQWYELRLFAEAQRAVHKHTDASLLRVFDGDRAFRDNIAGDRADQAGAALTLRASGGVNPAAARASAELQLHGETGDYSFVRPSVIVRTSTAAGRIALGVEAAAGTSFGDAPLQRHWQLGGSGTLRGYSAVAARGEAFWRGRAELGYGMPLVRGILFGDVGWAGARTDFSSSRPLRAAGIGVSILDGLVRLDVARALNEPQRWKLHLNFGGIF